jgi:hypothetical protein
MTDEANETRQRVAYELDPENKAMTVRFGEEALLLKTADDLDAVRDQLVLEGLRSFLQKATLRVADVDKLPALEAAYNELMAKGMAAFEKKGPGGHTGPKKAEKIAALAALKGTTPEIIKAKLKDAPTDKVNALLNSPKVLAAVEKLRSKGEQLELDL